VKAEEKMEPLTITLISFAIISGGALGGYYPGGVLPEDQRSDASKEAVKIGWGFVCTMSALILGFLGASGKNTYDSVGLWAENERSHFRRLRRGFSPSCFF
jgi:hypothetical protein